MPGVVYCVASATFASCMALIACSVAISACFWISCLLCVVLFWCFFRLVFRRKILMFVWEICGVDVVCFVSSSFFSSVWCCSVM